VLWGAPMSLRHLLLAASLLTACDPGIDTDEGDAPLSDYDALMEGAPTNAELPFEIKADGPAPFVHTDLLDLQSPVRSQGSRGTCSIFATAALMEHLYMAGGMEDPDFSEQYLQWSSKFEVGAFRDTSGSNAQVNLQAINRFGIVSEDAWRYEALEWGELEDPQCVEVDGKKPTHCYTNGQPPASAQQAEKFFLPPGQFLNSSRESIIDHIRVDGTGVVVGLDFFYQSWNHRKSTLPRNLDNWDAGIVLYPNDEDIEASHEQRAGHAVLIVGWDLEEEFPKRDAEGEIVRDAAGNPVMEKGFFIFKNSWGTEGFGIEHPHGAGYGWLSMAYVEEFGSARVSEVPELEQPTPDDDGGTTEGQTLSSSEVIAIPDNDSSGIASVLEAAAGEAIGDVTVKLDIGHTFRGDLVVTLEHAGVVAKLHEKAGGGQDDLKLELALSDFDGLDPAGAWTLRVVDTARADVGQLRSWSLTVE
jgi:hypothetical protein